MGDFRPFDTGSWSGPWFCAGSIDPRITDPTDISRIRERHVLQPALADFASGDHLRAAGQGRQHAVPERGCRSYRGLGGRLSRSTVDQPGVTCGSDLSQQSNGTGHGHRRRHPRRQPDGRETVTPGSNRGTGVQCPANADAGSCSCTGTGSGRTCRWTVTVDNRWKCGYSTSPMDGVTANPDGRVPIRTADPIITAL